MLGIVLVGAPGAGKGTQSRFICDEFNIPQISTGDMLRSAVRNGTTLGVKVRAIMDAGALVSDEIVIALVQERLTHDDCKNGYLFDGFPRTIAQANSLKNANVPINYVIEIDVPFNEIISRLSDRRVHPSSGRTYHLRYNPPKISGFDDITGEALIQRDDDKEETVINRLKIYRLQTEPLIDYYAKLDGINYIKINGTQDVELVKQQILKALGSM